MIGRRLRYPAALLLAAALAAACSLRPDAGSRDVLWRIVESCLAPGAPGYCDRCPAPVGAACGERPCARSTQV